MCVCACVCVRVCVVCVRVCWECACTIQVFDLLGANSEDPREGLQAHANPLLAGARGFEVVLGRK